MKRHAGTGSTADLAADLETGIERLGIALPPAAPGALLAYLAVLNKWNAAVNLTAIRDPHEQLVKHVFDCLAILGPLDTRLGPEAVVVDVGSGGGLPGLVLAICRPHVQVHCIDAVAKKARFVVQAAGALRLANVRAHHARVETLSRDRDVPGATLVTSRAFASLEDFVRLTRHLLADGGEWAAMKGQYPEDELASLALHGVHVDAVLPLSVPMLDEARHLVRMRPDAAMAMASASHEAHEEDVP